MKKWIWPCMGYALVLFFYTFNINSPHLWNDEAASALYVKNISNTGAFSAFDGRNIEQTYGCTHNPVNTTIERFLYPFYKVGSLFSSKLTKNHLNIRSYYAILSSFSFIFLFFFLNRYFSYFFSCLLCCSFLLLPQTIFFMRQSRHYGIDILFFSIFLYFLFKKLPLTYKNIVFSCLFLLSSLIHIIAPIPIFISYLCYLMLKKEHWSLFLFPLLSMCVFPLYIFLEHSHTHQLNPPFIYLLPKDSSEYITMGIKFLFNTFKNLDFSNTSPTLAWIFLFIFLYVRFGKHIVFIFQKNEILFLSLVCVSAPVIIAFFIGNETFYHYATVRHYPYIQISFSLLWVFLCHFFLLKPLQTYVSFLAVFALNIGSFSFWDLHSSHPISWIKPVYTEIFHHKPGPWQKTIDILKNVPHDKNDVLLVEPQYARDVFTYYLGDSFIVTPKALSEKSCGEEIKNLVGQEIFDLYHKPPSWVVSFGSPIPDLQTKENTQEIPVEYPTPDATRPELTRHFFYGSHKSTVYLSHITPKIQTP